MKTLDEICVAFGTDKGSEHPTGGHDYARHYGKLFSPLRYEAIKLLEIGVGGGQSIRAWLEYFPNAQVFGVDNVRDTNEWNSPGKKGRYTFVYGDQTDPTLWACFIVDYGGSWDIIIDDGGHFNDGIITSFNNLWPHVKSGGFYAVEDLSTAYGEGSIFVKPGFPNHADWVKSKVDALNIVHQYAIDSIYFAKELVVFRKAQ